MMYHEPTDIRTRMIRVPRETKSPSRHIASMPYGFGASSLVTPAAGAAAGAAASAAGAAAGAAAADAAGSCANAACGATATATPTENITAANRADKRVLLNMLPPKLK